MKRTLALILAVVLAFSSLACLTVFGSAETAAPSQEIVYKNISLKTNVHLLFAISAEGYESLDGLKLVVTKGEAISEYEAAGFATIYGSKYIVFRYNGLSAAEMDTVVSVYVEYNGVAGEAIEASVAGFAAEYKAANGKHTALVDAMLKYGASAKAVADAQAK